MGQAAVEAYGAAYDQPASTVTAASGDAGFNNENPEHQSEGKCTNCSPSFPADLASVVAVGGTTLYPEGTSGRGWQEYVWPFSGSGCALYIAKPAWQQDAGCTNRTTNDVAAVAGGETNVSIYDTFGQYHGWVNVAGTSIGAPLIAGTLALREAEGQTEGAEDLYGETGAWYDVTTGSNWWGLDGGHTYKECASALLCVAASGYDAPTGIGTPNGGAVATPPSAIALPAQMVTTTSATIRGVVNPEGSETTYRFEYGETREYGAETPVGGGSVSGYTTPSEKTAGISGLKPSTIYHYRVVTKSAAGTTYGGDRTFSTGPKVHQFNFSPSSGSEGSLAAPRDLATDPSGNIWVTDTGHDRIAEFSAGGAFIKTCGHSGSETPELYGTDIQFSEPSGIAIDPSSGWLYISDTGNDRIQVVRPLFCEFQDAFGSSGSAPGELSEPTGIAFGQHPGFFISEGPGELLVSDTGNDRVQVFAPRTTFAVALGDFLAAIGSTGSGNGQFERPTDVAPDPSEAGAYYVVDSGNNRVQRFKSTWDSESEVLTLAYTSQFGSQGSESGQLSSPGSLTVDPTTGDIAVTDVGNHRIEEFLPTGAYVADFGTGGDAPESVDQPEGISASTGGDLYIADSSNDRIEVWMPSQAYDPEWNITSAPNPSETQNSYLWGVSCITPMACTAVGRYSTNGNVTYAPVAERWNGAEWALESVPAPSGAEKASLLDVSCTLLSSCEAVGYYEDEAGLYRSLGAHWNGTEWTLFSLSEPSEGNSILEGVSCFTATACTAVGAYQDSEGVISGFAERWNGTQWSLQYTPEPSGAKATYPAGVSCSSPSRCMMAGSYEDSSGAETPFAATWDGSQWALQSMPVPSGGKRTEPLDVSCSAASACTSVGSYETSAGEETPLVEHWNGVEWSLQAASTPSGTTANSLHGVSCVNGNTCTAVGTSRDDSGAYTGLAEGWDGSNWALQPLPVVAGGQSWLSGGVSCPTDLFCAAVGNTGKAFAEVYGQAAAGTAFEGEAYPLTLAATGTYKQVTQGGYVECGEVRMSGSLQSRQSQVALPSELGDCYSTGTQFPTTVDMNSCHYSLDLDAGGPPYMAELGIDCAEEGDAIEVKAYLGTEYEFLLCTVKYSPQGELDRIALENVGAGSQASVSAEIDAGEVEYEQSGQYCETVAGDDGTIEGELTFTGEDEAEDPAGTFVR